MSITKLPALFTILIGLASSSLGQTPTPRFVFWYDKWTPDETVQKLNSADIVVGPDATGSIAELHASGKQALRYVTYYQARPKTFILPTVEDLPAVGFQQNGKFLPSRFGGKDNYAVCDDSSAVHDRVMQQLADTIKLGYDGIFVDNTSLDPTDKAVCQATHKHLRGNMRGDDAFLALLADVRTELKRQRPNAILVTNPFSPPTADGLGTGKGPSLWALSDYVLWENFLYSPNRAGDHAGNWHRDYIAMAINVTKDNSKRSKLLALSYPLNTDEAVSSFALARIFGFQWTANIGDADQNTQANSGHFGIFLAQVPFQLGDPVGNFDGTLQTLTFHRTFQHGEAWANASAQPMTVRLPRGKLYFSGQQRDVPASTTITLPPRSGAVLLR
jgi:hypothetical protein